MQIIISNAAGVPIYEQICGQLKAQISRGELAPGELLPSIRALAKDLRISVITTKRAYEELEREGYLHMVAGKGCYVAARPACGEAHCPGKELTAHLTAAAALARGEHFSAKELHALLDEILKGVNL